MRTGMIGLVVVIVVAILGGYMGWAYCHEANEYGMTGRDRAIILAADYQPGPGELPLRSCTVEGEYGFAVLRGGPGADYETVALMPNGHELELTSFEMNGYHSACWQGRYSGWVKLSDCVEAGQ